MERRAGTISSWFIHDRVTGQNEMMPWGQDDVPRIRIISPDGQYLLVAVTTHVVGNPDLSSLLTPKVISILAALHRVLTLCQTTPTLSRE